MSPRGIRTRTGRPAGGLAARLRLGLALAAVLVFLLACAPTRHTELGAIREDQYQIANPSKTEASATGIGCGLSRKEALLAAKRISHYNLRSLTGAARYHVSYEVLRTVPDPNLLCLEVEARAHP